MSQVSRARAALAALCVTLWLPASASAWTEAQVQSATAYVDVEESGEARVRLELSVAVRGGWLEELEVAGLDPDLELDPESPVRFVSDEGERHEPRLRTRDGGRVTLSFRRRGAPRRGNYTATLAYRTSLAGRATRPIDGDRVRVEWTLPGWRSGLDGVTIHMTAPPGARQPEEISEVTATIQHARTESAGRSILTWRRAHLPRTVPWTVVVDVPAGNMSPDLSEATAAPTTPSAPAEEASVAEAPTANDPLPGRVVAALLALLLLLSLSAFARAARDAQVRPRPLLPLPIALRALSIVGLAVGAAFRLAGEPLLGIGLLCLAVLLGLERTPDAPSAPRLGGWSPATPDDIREARLRCRRERLSLLGLLDATTPLGALSLALLLGGVWIYLDERGLTAAGDALGLRHALLLFVPIFLTGTRHQLPASAAARLERLHRFADRLRLPLDARVPVALRLSIHRDAQGRWQDARIRLLTTKRRAGLVRLDVTLAERRGLGGLSTHPVLLVVTRIGTTAEAALAELAPKSPWRNAPGGRRARVFPWSNAIWERVAAVTAPPEKGEAADHFMRDSSDERIRSTFLNSRATSSSS